jgi:hypothetical protein
MADTFAKKLQETRERLGISANQDIAEAEWMLGIRQYPPK